MTLLYSAKFLSHRRDRGANSRQGDQCHSKSEGALPNYAIDAGLTYSYYVSAFWGGGLKTLAFYANIAYRISAYGGGQKKPENTFLRDI